MTPAILMQTNQSCYDHQNAGGYDESGMKLIHNLGED